MSRRWSFLCAVLLGLNCSSEQGVAPGENCVIRSITTDAALSISLGQTVRLQSAVEQTGCTNLPRVIWSSGNPGVISTTPDGEVTGVAVGQGTLTVRLEGRAEQATAVITVRGRVSGVTIAPGTVNLFVAGSIQLTPTVDADPGTSLEVRWSSNDPARAAVDEAGRVIGIAAGTATITATSLADTTHFGIAQVVVQPRVSSVLVTPERDTLLVTETVQLQTTVSGDSGVVLAVSWRSRHPEVATVSTDGLVTGLTAGEAEIVAASVADTTRQAIAHLLIRPRVLGVSLSAGPASIDVGATHTFSAIVTGDSGISPTVTWRSSNPATATISATGVLTGIAAGSTTISVRSTADTTRLAEAVVQVRARILGISVSPSTLSMTVGETSQLIATLTADPGATSGVLWSTEDPAVATVNQQGIVSAIAVGTSIITARPLADSSKRAQVNVTVSLAAPPPPPVPAGSLCFGPTNGGGGQRVLPDNTLDTGSFNCTSRVDLVPGQTFGLFGMVNGVARNVSWQLPSTSIATFAPNPDVLVISAIQPGTVTVTASDDGLSGTLTIRIGALPAMGFCLSTSPTGPCMTAASAKAGQVLTIYALAGGQTVGAAISVLSAQLMVPVHLASSLSIVPPVPGIYLVNGATSNGGAGSAILVTVIP